MGITKHVNIISALKKRAMRYHNKDHHKEDTDDRLYDEAVDETGTIDTTSLTDSDADTLGEQQQTKTATDSLERIEIEIKEMVEMAGLSEEILEVHGIAPGKKPEGVPRWIYENLNGLNNRIGGNKKLDKAKEIINDLEVDIVAYNEHSMNLGHKQNRNGLSQMFNNGECAVRSVAGHNVHEKQCGKVQQGGTAMMLYGPLIEQFYF